MIEYLNNNKYINDIFQLEEVDILSNSAKHFMIPSSNRNSIEKSGVNVILFSGDLNLTPLFNPFVFWHPMNGGTLIFNIKHLAELTYYEKFNGIKYSLYVHQLFKNGRIKLIGPKVIFDERCMLSAEDLKTSKMNSFGKLDLVLNFPWIKHFTPTDYILGNCDNFIKNIGHLFRFENTLIDERIAHRGIELKEIC